MPTNDYHFITHWRVVASLREVVEVIADAEDLPRWWPAVYLDVREIAQGDERGVGKRVSLYTKGWLPYTLRWQFVVTEVTPVALRWWRKVILSGGVFGRLKKRASGST